MALVRAAAAAVMHEAGGVGASWSPLASLLLAGPSSSLPLRLAGAGPACNLVASWATDGEGRAISHFSASTSSSSAALPAYGPLDHHAASGRRHLGAGGRACSHHLGRVHLAMQQQQQRSYGYLPPKRQFRLPDYVEAVVREEAARQPRRPRAQAAKEVPPLRPRPLLEESRRVGCIATKAGMTQEWDEHGVRVPLTVLWVDECQVVGVKTPRRHGCYALQLGSGHKRQKCMAPSLAGFYLKAGLPLKRFMAEWRVSRDALLPVGTHITSAHFVAGQRVDVTGWTKRKGFQGVMKRWGYKGLPASHGVSLAHRHPGSIGGRQDPGRIWKGKKLPGHMGNERRTLHNCLVYKVDATRNLVYVRGQVPGPVGKSVLLRDGRLAQHAIRATWGLPFPTHLPPAPALALPAGAVGEAAAAAAEAAVAEPGREPGEEGVSVYRNPKDPYRMYREDGLDYQPIPWKKGGD